MHASMHKQPQNDKYGMQAMVKELESMLKLLEHLREE
jgi:hypothetical protein